MVECIVISRLFDSYLHAKGNGHVANGKALAVDGAHRHTKVLRVDVGELRNGICILATGHRQRVVVQLRQQGGELSKYKQK